MDGSHGSSGGNNDTITTTGPSWREKAKWKWNAMLQEFGPDGKKRKTMNDNQRVDRTEDAEEEGNEYGPSQPVRGEGCEDAQVYELEDDPMEEDEDGEEDDYETDLQGESRKRRTESAGETSESGSSHEAQDGIHHQKPRDVRHHGTSHHPTAPSGPSRQPDDSSAPVDSNMLVASAPAKKRRIRVRESKNHWCEQCGKRFSRPSQLLTHSFTHSGEKPHQCHMCYKHFNVASNLKRHIRTHASSRRKSSRIGNTVFRGFALGYPTSRISNAESTSTTTTESASASTSTNTDPNQETSNLDYNHGQPGSSGAQGHSTRAGIRRTDWPAVKHLLVQDSEASKSNGSSSGSGSSTGRVPVMPPPSGPSHHPPGPGGVPGRKGGSGQHRGHVDEDDRVEVPDG
ncbi:hypothetical protein BG000_011777 [Podila horticola]|nr:hypothetical protein BG000_011777 [Podila horticola]